MGDTTVIIDYGCGNLFSVENAVKKITRNFSITSDAEVIRQAQKLILPGVGSFRVAMENLESLGLVNVIRQCAANRTPILGICLGMQLLLSKGYEHGETNGLGLVQGEVIPFIPTNNDRVPHIGWNDISSGNEKPLFLEGIEDGTSFYFVHSYYCDLKEECRYVKTHYCNQDVVVGLQKDNVMGVQFHPEKSQDAGLALLKNFIAS